jgi:hypothetical protein
MMPSLPEIFFFGIVFYLLYKFLFNFFLPIFKTTKAFKEQFRNMRDNMQDQAGPFQQHKGAPQSAGHSNGNNGQPKKPDPTRSPNTMGEYIDFEEIK